MKSSTASLLVSLMATVAMATPLAVDLNARAPETTKEASPVVTSDLTWEGQVEVGGANVTLKGTAESIYHQILAINPEYDSQLGSNPAGSNATQALEKRDNINSNSINCGVGQEGYDIPVLQGIDYLYKIGNGGCVAPPGHGGCAHVYCPGGILLCNDHPTSITVPCRLVADNAAGIVGRCSKTYFFPSPVGPGGGGLSNWVTYTQGQIFSFDGKWNTIVSSDATC